MKTKEFVRQVEALGYIVVLDDGIFDIYDNGNAVALVYEKELFRISLTRGKAVNKSLFDYCVEYAQTPLAEREEEKRYYLRLATKIDVYEDRRYLNMDIPNEKYTLSENKDDAYYKASFTESEIAEMDITGFEKEPVE